MLEHYLGTKQYHLVEYRLASEFIPLATIQPVHDEMLHCSNYRSS